MSNALKFLSNLSATNATVNGVAGIFLPGRSLSTDGDAVQDCIVQASQTGPSQWEYALHTGSQAYIDPETETGAVVVHNSVTGVLISAINGYPTPSIDANGLGTAIFRCSLPGGNGSGGRSGVS